MPRDWKGKFDGPVSVKLFGSNEDWQIYYTAAGHEGWAKAPEDVARAFHAFPARG
jgi:hypothetical protein